MEKALVIENMFRFYYIQALKMLSTNYYLIL